MYHAIDCTYYVFKMTYHPLVTVGMARVFLLMKDGCLLSFTVAEVVEVSSRIKERYEMGYPG